MVIQNNNVQLILDEYAITQIELADEADLSLSTVSKACRRVGTLSPVSEAAIAKGVNALLAAKGVKKKYEVEAIFSSEHFGKI